MSPTTCIICISTRVPFLCIEININGTEGTNTTQIDKDSTETLLEAYIVLGGFIILCFCMCILICKSHPHGFGYNCCCPSTYAIVEEEQEKETTIPPTLTAELVPETKTIVHSEHTCNT